MFEIDQRAGQTLWMRMVLAFTSQSEHTNVGPDVRLLLFNQSGRHK
jgi:hypothetical protein